MKPQVLSTLNRNCGDSIKAAALSHSSSLRTAYSITNSLQKQMHGHQKREALILDAEEKECEQKLTVFSMRLLYYEFTSDLNSGAKDDVKEMAGRSDPPPQVLKNASMRGDINHHKKQLKR